MLSEREQRLWDEIERNYRAGDDDGARSGSRTELPATIVGGAWGTVLLVLFGVPWAGVAVGSATALIWLLWRFLPQLPDRTAGAELSHTLSACAGTAAPVAVTWQETRASVRRGDRGPD
jgi:Protein of unknown function (DUF3040)